MKNSSYRCFGVFEKGSSSDRLTFVASIALEGFGGFLLFVTKAVVSTVSTDYVFGEREYSMGSQVFDRFFVRGYQAAKVKK